MAVMQISIHRSLALVLALAAPLAFAACGGSSGASSTSGSSSTTSSAASGSANRAEIQSCLKQHGVDLPVNAGQGNGGPPGGLDPSQGGAPPSLPGGANLQKLQDALKACGVNGNGAFPGGGSPANRQAFQAYSSCMKDHGVDFPTPGAGGSGGSTPSTADRTSQTFKTANDVCKVLLPAGAANGSSPTTAG
jgi:hypothetical protein